MTVKLTKYFNRCTKFLDFIVRPSFTCSKLLCAGDAMNKKDDKKKAYEKALKKKIKLEQKLRKQKK